MATFSNGSSCPGASNKASGPSWSWIGTGWTASRRSFIRGVASLAVRSARSRSISFSRTVGQFLELVPAGGGEAVEAKPQLPTPRATGDRCSEPGPRSTPWRPRRQPERDRLIIRLLADTGMRVGELCTLTAESIVTRDHRTFLKVTGKGRQRPLGPVAAAAGPKAGALYQGPAQGTPAPATCFWGCGERGTPILRA